MPRRKGYLSRTLPRVRELKPTSNLSPGRGISRTLPRVRELKHGMYDQLSYEE